MSEPMEAGASPSAAWSLLAIGRWPAAALSVARNRADVVQTIGTSLTVFLMTAVQGVLLAQLLGPEARGEYSAVTFYTQTLTYIGLLGALLAIARRAARGADDYQQLARSALRLGAGAGLATIAVVAVLLFVGLPAEKRFLAPLGLACAMLLPCEQMRLALLAVDQGRGEYRRFNALRLMAALVFPCSLAVLWIAGGASLPRIVGLTIASSLVSLAITLCSEPRFAWRGPASPPPTKLVREGLPYAAALAVSDLFNRLDMLLILWLAELTVQGYYAAAVPAANLLIVAPNALSIFSFNAGAKKECSLSAMCRAAAGVAALQAVSAIGFALMLKPLMMLVYGARFEGAVPLALALLPAYAINGCSQVAEGYLRGRGKPSAGVWARVAGGLAMAATVFALFSQWREMSVPIGASVGQAVAGLWILWALVAEARQARNAAKDFGLLAVEATP
ncbi:MAG TPA: oligosaccharide flippase family protein [Pirellulales bacterium]|nr:oligosaccharide flippase family protein [Pirellulales bacterium]